MECKRCENLPRELRLRHRRACRECEHSCSWLPRTPIKWDWSRCKAGYSRLVPPEDISRAMTSIVNARSRGAEFEIKRTFAGMRITVVIPARSRACDRLDDEFFNEGFGF